VVSDIWRRAIRYYEDDLVIVDYDTAIVVDSSSPTISKRSSSALVLSRPCRWMLGQLPSEAM